MAREISETRQLLTDLIRSSAEAIVFADLNGIVQFTNPAADQLYGYAEGELIGQNVDVFNSHLTHQTDEIVAAIKNVGHWQGELIQKRKDQSTFYSALRVSLIFDEDQVPIGLGSHSHDISTRKEYEQQIQHLAHHDALTNLPNRVLFFDRLDQGVKSANQSGIQSAILCLDLDGFKAINDARGHPIGDELLKIVARRLQDCIEPQDTVARMGGDEFTIILKDLDKDSDRAAAQAEQKAEQILDAINQGIQLDHSMIYLSCSIGINLFCKSRCDPIEILQQADRAMYRSKERGKNAISFFEAELQKKVNVRMKIARELTSALQSDNELELYYQPILSIQDNQIIGYEALMRWQQGEELRMPDSFISIAEESGQIQNLGHQALRRVLLLRQNLWKQSKDQPRALAINISPLQFKQPDFVRHCKQLLDQFEQDGDGIVFDISEKIFEGNFNEVFQKVTALKELGIQFYIDDFGVGQSSLNQLRQLPLDGIKIDRSFIHTIDSNLDDNPIVNLIINLAQSLHIKSVAEGIETQGQYQALKNSGCDYYQGFYHSPAQPGNQIGWI